MKFESVSIGDTVFIEEYVSYGWNTSSSFWVPRKIAKTTKTQLITDDNRRFRKEDGKEIGGKGFSYAKNIGDTYGFGSNKKVCDQSADLIDFKNKIRKELLIRNRLENINIGINSPLSLEELDNIISLIYSIESIVSK